MANIHQLPHSRCYYMHFKCIINSFILKTTPRSKYDYHSHLIEDKVEDKGVKYRDTQLEMSEVIPGELKELPPSHRFSQW